MVYAPHARQWHFTGGLIDPGESPRESALRELLEETNQKASATFLGVMHWNLGQTQVMHQRGEVYGTIFVGTLSEERPLILQESEVTEWRWVKDDEPLDFLEPLVRVLVELVREKCGSTKETPSHESKDVGVEH